MKVIAFDLFGTVFDFSGTPRNEIKDYAAQIRQPEWAPLILPKSWENMPAFADSAEGITKLRTTFFVVTCSNALLGLQAKMCKHAGISFDALIPIELNRVYKPTPKAYMTICGVLKVDPQDVLMVTANKDFGDLEASKALGMESVLIRDGDGPKTIIELAELLGC